MPAFSLAILYVADPLASAAFYARLFGHDPVERSPTFCMLPLGGGAMLGLWVRDGVRPLPDGSPGGSELAYTVDDGPSVDRLHADWSGQGITILEPPTDHDFGRSFVVADPDGHRLRVFAPAAEASGAA